jgi:cation diffusion facilitator family transporter
MRPERRIALASIAAAVVLIVVKLAAGLASGSLGLLSEAAHSGTDLAAAILTFFAVGVAVRPADLAHPYGHGKAEHLAALAEATFLGIVSVVIGAIAIDRLVGPVEHEVDPAWWAFLTIGVVIAIDASRTLVSWRGAQRYPNAALATNALHFAGDFGGSLAVLVGLVLVRADHPKGDPAAALFVAVLVLLAATRLMRKNVDVLMDRSPDAAEAAVRGAIDALEPPVDLRRLRMRYAAGRHFADVVIGVPSEEAVGQGHATADAVEDAVEHALPGSDVVVHVEPAGAEDGALRERAHAAALKVARVREIHNVAVLHAGGRTEISLHLKLPGDLPLSEAHDVAEEVEAAIHAELPGIESVQTHLEPLGEETSGRALAAAASAEEREAVRRIVLDVGGCRPRELRLFHTDAGLVVFLTLGLDADRPLADAHASASEIEERIRRERPEIADVIVHTEP